MMRTIVFDLLWSCSSGLQPSFFVKTKNKQVSARFKASGKLLVIANVSEC